MLFNQKDKNLFNPVNIIYLVQKPTQQKSKMFIDNSHVSIAKL